MQRREKWDEDSSCTTMAVIGRRNGVGIMLEPQLTERVIELNLVSDSNLDKAGAKWYSGEYGMHLCPTDWMQRNGEGAVLE